MNILAPVFITLFATGTLSTNFFGDVNRRSIADVCAELDSVAHLPPSAFERVVPSILDIVRSARSTALTIRAMDLVCAKAGTRHADELIRHLNECLDEVHTDKKLQKRVLIECFVSGDLSQWGEGLRQSPATVVFLNRVVRYKYPDSPGGLDPSVSDFAVDALLNILPSEAAKRLTLLAIIRDQAPGAHCATKRLPALVDAQSLQSLRELAAQPKFNGFAIQILSHIGDIDSLPILQRRHDAVVPRGLPGRDERVFLERAILRINLQHPPSKLIDYIRSPDQADDGDHHFWAVRRAVELKLEKSQIRAAVLGFATTLGPYHIGDWKEHAVRHGILEPTDLPDAGPSHSRLYGSGPPPKRRSGHAPVPSRKAKGKSWSPNDANYEVLGEWLGTVQWETLTAVEGAQLLKGKLCILDLLHPTNCQASP